MFSLHIFSVITAHNQYDEP